MPLLMVKFLWDIRLSFGMALGQNSRTSPSVAPHRPSPPDTPLFGYCVPQASAASQSPSAIQAVSSSGCAKPALHHRIDRFRMRSIAEGIANAYDNFLTTPEDLFRANKADHTTQEPQYF